NNAQPGAALPSAEFVSDLHRRLADQLDETDAPVGLAAARLSRRRVIGGLGAAAAAAVAGAVVDRALLSSGSAPSVPRAPELVPPAAPAVATPSGAGEQRPDRDQRRPTGVSAPIRTTDSLLQRCFQSDLGHGGQRSAHDAAGLRRLGMFDERRFVESGHPPD